MAAHRRPIGEAGWGRTLGAGIVAFVYFFPVLWIILAVALPTVIPGVLALLFQI